MKVALAFPLMILATSVWAYDDDAIRRFCDDQWGTNFEMVSFCRGQQRTAGSKLDQLREKAASDTALATILGGCTEQWGTNYKMVLFCHSQQEEALAALQEPPPDLPDDVVAVVRQQCDEQWGTNYEVVVFCVEQQSDAWRSLQ